jgi:ABC-type multidrug transport system fused ATPase/permease subunit
MVNVPKNKGEVATPLPLTNPISDPEKPQQKNGSSSLLSKLGLVRSGSKKPKKKQQVVGLLSLFRYSNKRDKFLIVTGLVFSMGVGSLQPINTIILGTFLRSFSDLLNQGPGADILTPVIPVILIFVYLGIANLVGGYICQCCWVLSGEFQTRRIRKKYVHAILRQEMSWFDKADEGSLTTRLAADTNLIQDGISEKFGQLVQSVSQFVCGFIIAFVKGWRLALVLLAALPLMGKWENQLRKLI